MEKLKIINNKNIEVWKFDFQKSKSNKLFNLVETGKKTATSYLFNNEKTINKFSYLTNYDCSKTILLETVMAFKCKFSEINAAMAELEGEGDFAYWKKEHKKFFSSELKHEKFNEDVKIIFEIFKVVKIC